MPFTALILSLSVCRTPMPFTAFIGSGSDPEITVSPTSGILASCRSKGTLFVVTYRPTMYGKNHCAKFVVQASESKTNCLKKLLLLFFFLQCDTTEWCYKIIGKLPRYTIHSHKLPIALSSNIETVK